MPKTENAEVVKVFFERVLNSGDFSSLGSLSHREVILPERGPGIENLRKQLTELRSTFANPEYKIVDTISEDEKVAVRFSAKATHEGRYMSIPGSGRKLKLWGVMMFRFEAGLIAEFWSVFDSSAILKQLREPQV